MKLLLSNSDYRFMMILWKNEPVASGALAELCREELGWKKSTTYTVMKRLIDKGFVKNENTIVTASVAKEECQREEARALIDRAFSGSRPDFLAAFRGNFGISEEEEREIREIIDRHSSRREKTPGAAEDKNER